MPRRYLIPRALLTLALLVALLPVALRPAPALAATCEVTNGNNLGAGSLRAALDQTNGYTNCATITFAPGVAEVTVTSRLVIARDVALQRPSAGALTIRYAGPVAANGSVLWIRQGTVVITGLTITGGRTVGIWGAGLTITGDQGATAVTLDGVTVTDNIAKNAGGGGIYASSASLTLVNTTVSNNKVDNADFGEGYGGGGLFLDDNYGNITATLTGSTVRENDVGNNLGGGILLWDRAAGRGWR